MNFKIENMKPLLIILFKVIFSIPALVADLIKVVLSLTFWNSKFLFSEGTEFDKVWEKR